MAADQLLAQPDASLCLGATNDHRRLLKIQPFVWTRELHVPHPSSHLDWQFNCQTHISRPNSVLTFYGSLCCYRPGSGKVHLESLAGNPED